MTHDEFHLTPVDIRNQEFPRSLRGYDVAAVDEFRNRVADEVERLLRERAQLEERVGNFREQLKAFREREKAMSEALVAAQRLKDESLSAAQRERDVIVQQARLEADRILEEARSTEQRLRRDQADAERQLTGYLTAFRQLLVRNLAAVEALEAEERNGTEPSGGDAA